MSASHAKRHPAEPAPPSGDTAAIRLCRTGESRFFAVRVSPDRLENERHEGASGRKLLIASWIHRPRSGDREIQCMLGTGRSHCNLAISSLSCSFRRFISANFNSSLAGYTNSFAISLSSAS
jgi:hypothetical protein